MKTIDRIVPEGQTLTVAGLRFVGPTRAKAHVPEGAVEKTAATPPPKPRTAPQRPVTVSEMLGALLADLGKDPDAIRNAALATRAARREQLGEAPL